MSSSGQDVRFDSPDASAEAVARNKKEAVAQASNETSRIIDPVVEEGWAEKYKNFSAPHMKRAYRAYAVARKDPFNKDPSWGLAVLAKLSRMMKAQGVTPQKLFSRADDNGDGMLDRAEVRRMMLPFNLSDMEFTAIYDILDSDQSNLVDLSELSEALFGQTFSKGVAPGPSPHYNRSIAEVDPKGSQWRSPVHRVKRLPPAIIEGWDHLHAPPEFRSEADMIQSQGQNLLARVGADLCLSARGRNPAAESKADVHRYFGGGFDASRFYRAQVADEKRRLGVAPPVAVPDPGYEPRPGYHIKLAEVSPQFCSPRSGRSNMPMAR